MERGVAVITGGSRGIGAAVARSVAAAGWTVCLSYRADGHAAAAVADSLPGALAVQADVAVEADVTALFAAADALGPVTAFVANAGIVGERARVDELSFERVQRMLAVNVTGTFMCCREAVRRMSSLRGGRGGSI